VPEYDDSNGRTKKDAAMVLENNIGEVAEVSVLWMLRRRGLLQLVFLKLWRMRLFIFVLFREN